MLRRHLSLLLLCAALAAGRTAVSGADPPPELPQFAAAWTGPQAGAKALTTYCHAVMNAAAFLCVD